MSTSNSSKNALSHGVYSSEVVLPWEDEREFTELHEQLREELFPNGRSEEEAVFDLACLYWKKRRLNVGSQLAFRRDAHFSELADAGRREGWKGIIDYIASTSPDIAGMNASIRDSVKSYSKAAKSVWECVRKQTEQMLAPDTTNQEGEQSKTDKLEELIRLLKELQASGAPIAPMLRMVENRDLDDNRWLQAYRPDLLEKELKICAEIDKRIERVKRRLVLAKEYKKQYCAKDVKALPAPATTLPTNFEQVQSS